MRVVFVLVLLGACAFERGYSPGAGDDTGGGMEEAPTGTGSGSTGGMTVERSCMFPDPELRLCIEVDNRVFSPVVIDGAPGKLDATTRQVSEATRAGKFAARMEDGAQIQIPEADLLDPLDGLTIEMWLRPADRRAAALLTNVGQYYVQLTDSNRIVCGVPGAQVVGDFGDAADPGQWTHIACTFDNDTLAVYVNGRLSEDDEINAGYLSDAGTSGTVLGGGFVGMIDDLRIYGRAFAGAEVCAHAGDACGD